MRSLARSSMVVLSSLAFVACEGAPVAPARVADDVPLADAVSNTIDRDIVIDAFPSCNGDVLSGTTTEHTVFSASSDGAGGFHINYKDQLTDMRLTGSPSGASYLGSSAAMENDYISPSQVLSGVVMKHFDINLIGRGQTPNLRLQGVTRIVISANGIERVFTDTFTAVCH